MARMRWTQVGVGGFMRHVRLIESSPVGGASMTAGIKTTAPTTQSAIFQRRRIPASLGAADTLAQRS
jgi:hypothetical protein